MKPIITNYYPGIMLLVISMAIGIFCFKDYGVAWDEPIQREIGITSYRYIFQNDQALKATEFRDLGTGFELPLVFIEKLLNLDDSRDIYQVRHLATYLFFMVSVFCGYILALRIFKDQFIACLCFIMLAFHPRMFAHAYFNSKDIPFLSSFLIVFLVSHLAFEKNKPAWYLLLGAACGYATSIRALGILLVPCITVFFLIDFSRIQYLKGKKLPVIRNFMLFIAGFCGLLYLAWPILWSDPVYYFTEEFQRLSHINWGGDVFFQGKNIKGSMLPLNYLPVWFSITMPELWLFFGITGFVWVISSFIIRPMEFLLNTPERNFLLYIACFIGPVIAVIALNSVNYDDWRHLYFIYPSFVMLACYAVSKLARGRKKIIVQSVCLLQTGYLIFFMIRFHPFEQVYFNHLVSHKSENLRKNYDLDYWDTAYKQGLEYILAHDHAPSIRVNCVSGPIIENVAILPEQSRKRIVIVQNNEHPDYFITNFRNHPEEFNYPTIFYDIKVLNSTIFRVYKLH